MFLAQATPAPQTPLAPPTPSPHAQGAASGAYIPQRVYDTRRKAFTDFETMLADLARADVVLVGEQHDDPNTHRLESAILAGLMRRGSAGHVVARDVRARRAGAARSRTWRARSTEEDFLKGSRPWPRYATDYRPLVEMAKGHGWPRRRGERAAADRVRGREERASRRSTALQPDDSAVARDASCSARRTRTSTRFCRADGRSSGGRRRRERPGGRRQGGRRPARDGRTLLPVAVREGRDDGRVDRRRPSRSRTDGPAPSCTSTAPSTATSARAPPSACGAGCPGRRVAIVSMIPDRRPRHARAGRRRPEARRLSGLHGQVTELPKPTLRLSVSFGGPRRSSCESRRWQLESG